MKWGKNLIGLVVVVILGLSLILVPVVSRLSPVQAAVTWKKSGEVTLENELYVVDAWVIKESSTSYKMWYTHAKSIDLSISEIIDAITALDLDALIDDIANLDLAQFLSHLDDLTADVSDIVDLLDGISTVIGYATSTNGKTWTVQNSEALVGSSNAAWDSVGAPCVIKNSDTDYEMWYTRAKIDLTQTDLEDILDDIAVGSQADRKAAILDFLDSISTVIGYATSTNGTDWAVQGSQVLPVNIIDVWSSVADPCVVKTDSSYEMWYTRPKTDLDQADLDTILTNIGTFGIDDLLDILDGTSTVIGYATSNNGVTWTEQNYQVLPVSSVVGAWDSVADPSVVKTGSSYEMWYTNVKTNLLEADLHTLANEIKELDIADLWITLNDEGIFQFITDLVAGIDDIKALLDSTSTVIGYATWDGVSANWTVQNPQHLVGSGPPWDSVAAPSVVKTGSTYEMWYTEGISDLIWQNLLDLLLGDNLPIGYAYYTPPAPRPPPLVIETNLFGIEESFLISSEGEILETIEATSEDGNLTVTIEAGTIALLEDEPLETLEAAVEPSPPEPPEDSNVIGLVYDFGPDKATFDLPITLTFTYDESLIPEGVAEGNLVIAMWDEEAGEWVELQDITVDPETNTITAKVSHFTAFTVLAYTRPAVFVASDLSITPAEVDIEEEVTISVLITNTGDLTGSYEVTLKIDDVVVDTKEVTLAGGASQRVSFTATKDVADTYSVDVSGLTRSFTVKEEIVPPVVPPVPAAFTISSLTISPAEVDVGKSVTISVLASNTGDLTGSYEVTLKIDNVVVATKEVTLAGGASQKVTFTTTKDVAGTYTVNVNGQSSTFTVKEEVVPLVVPPVTKPIAWWVWLIIGLVSAVIVGFAVWMVMRRRRA